MTSDSQASEVGGPRLTIYEHLDELRRRLIWTFGAMAIGMVIAFTFREWIFAVLTEPLLSRLRDQFPEITSNEILIQTQLTEGIATSFQVILIAGLVIVFPFVLYQFIAFVSPAMTPKEKRYFFTLMPFFFALLLSGIAFGYFIGLPPALEFLVTFSAEVARPQIKLNDYVDTVLKLLLWLGLIFQLPLLMYFMTFIGVINPWKIAGFRKYALVLSFVIGAIVTPTFDPVNQTLFAVPTYLLFEVGYLASKVAWRGRPKPAGVK